VTGRRTSEDAVPEDIEATTVTRIKFASDVTFDALTSFFGEPFQNTGPLPPRVEQETTYTLGLALSNSSNTIEDARITAVLPPYVRWNNRIAPANEDVSFDPVSRRIEWNIGTLKEHAGFLTPQRVVEMQVTLIPSVSQAGETPVLLFDPVFEGVDSFTNTTITKTAIEPNITLAGARDLEETRVAQ